MDRNTIIGLLVIFGILIGYSLWISPSQEELQRQQQIRDSLERVAQEKKAQQQEAQQQKEQKQPEGTPQDTYSQEQDTEKPASQRDLKSELGSFAEVATGENKHYTIENELIKLQISSQGGRPSRVRLKKYQTYDSLPVVLFTEDASNFGFTFFAEKRPINTKDLYFTPEWKTPRYDGMKNMTIQGNEEIQFAMRLYPARRKGSRIDKDHYIEYLYTLKGDSYMVDFDIKFVGMDEYISRTASYIDLDWNADLRRQDKELGRNIGTGSSIYYKYHNGDVDNLSERNDEDEEEIKTRLKWVAFKQRFFSTVLMADEAFANASLRVETKGQKEGEEKPYKHYLKTMTTQMSLPYSSSESVEYPLQFYFGPNKFNLLKEHNQELTELIPLGWGILNWINRFVVIPVFNYLESFNLNYGIIILILTILLKIVLFPIAYKTYKSQAKMRVLKPEIDEISKKYPNKEDAMKKQQATMNLYKKAGVNPAAGCVPMLLQLPILIAMFRFFPASIELRQQSFLWATDLSSYDSIVSLPFSIPFYGDHVSLFTLLMTISTVLYTRINNQMMGSSQQQMPGMKAMIYIMPVMLLVFLNNYASALSYYYLLANLITFGQMFLIKRNIDEDKIHKQLAMNKKKPAKKSKWQQRMEAMAKEKQKQQKRKR
ncbi:MAG: membrane protein insertase YidC [Bacteroidales bacterium]|nr:membrane protein insertase YidC [Bacteroidales bacterium]MCF8333385.1 membrane protein insertase YidC [Bacteroidales bacterium]